MSTGLGGDAQPLDDADEVNAGSSLRLIERATLAFWVGYSAAELKPVNLPAKDKNAEPGYQTLPRPGHSLLDGAGPLPVIVGDYDGHRGPAHTRRRGHHLPIVR